MTSEDDGSVTGWIVSFKKSGQGNDTNSGQDEARRLWERYYGKLVRQARHHLEKNGARRKEADEEDIALSAFKSFCFAAQAGRFPQLDDRDDLWKLLLLIVRCKAADQAQREARDKRDERKVVAESDLAAPGQDRGDGPGLDQFSRSGPTPAEAAEMAEDYRRLLSALDDDTQRRIVLMRMEGYKDHEIAERLDCTRRTVARKLSRVRSLWQEELPTSWRESLKAKANTDSVSEEREAGAES